MKDGAQRRPLQDLSREQLEELIGLYAKNWLALDGVWFQAAERRYRFPCRIIGKIKVCSGHQFLARLSRLFLFLLFIAYSPF